MKKGNRIRVINKNSVAFGYEGTLEAIKDDSFGFPCEVELDNEPPGQDDEDGPWYFAKYEIEVCN